MQTTQPTTVNDIHSQLNATEVGEVIAPIPSRRPSRRWPEFATPGIA